MRVAIARSAFWVAKPAGHTLIASFARKVFKTRTFSLMIAIVLCSNVARAIARLAIWMVIIAAVTTLATQSSKAFFAQTF